MTDESKSVQSQQPDKWEGYIPTPLRRKMGLKVPRLGMAAPLSARIDISGGPSSCWPWLGPLDRDGYGVVTRKGRAHRLVWEDHHGRKLGRDEVVRHSCDMPSCCNPAHLELGTQQDNVDDRVERGRSARGAMNGRAKLKAKTVLAIFQSPQGVCELARRYDLHESTVRSIKTGKTWGWLISSYSKD